MGQIRCEVERGVCKQSTFGDSRNTVRGSGTAWEVSFFPTIFQSLGLFGAGWGGWRELLPFLIPSGYFSSSQLCCYSMSATRMQSLSCLLQHCDSYPRTRETQPRSQELAVQESLLEPPLLEQQSSRHFSEHTVPRNMSFDVPCARDSRARTTWKSSSLQQLQPKVPVQVSGPNQSGFRFVTILISAHPVY